MDSRSAMTAESRRARARDRAAIAFSNFGHTCTHMFTVLYATAVLHLPQVFGLPYGELLSLSSLGLMLFGVAALPAGWLGDRWSQVGMMVIFFLGIGAGAIVTGLAGGPGMIFAGLTMIGLFAAIYHPVGIAWIVASARKQGMSLGINGVFGNVGNSLAPVFVGVMIDYFSWRAAFLIPGAVAVLAGIALLVAWRQGRVADARTDRAPPRAGAPGDACRVFVVLTLTMACSGFVYAGLTNTMPKLFEMGLGDGLATSYTQIGLLVGIVSGRRLRQRHPGRLARGSVLGAKHLPRLLDAPGAVAVRDRVGGRRAAAGGRIAGPELQPLLHRRGEHARRAIHAGTLALARLRSEVRAGARRRRPDGHARRLGLRHQGRLRPALRLARVRGHRCRDGGAPCCPAGEDPSSAGANPPPCPRAPTERGILSCRRPRACRRASKTKRRWGIS